MRAILALEAQGSWDVKVESFIIHNHNILSESVDFDAQ